MIRKRRLHHYWTRFRLLKPWYFLVLALISAAVCLYALRANNETMIKLRQAVYTADQNDSDVQGALERLQAYVTAHMNTDLSAGPNAVYPPIQLKYTYDRLVQAQSAAATAFNQQIYTEAQNYCQQLDPVDFSGHNRVPCIEQYVQNHSTQQTKAIPDALYKFDFVSPKWSPDLAGWTLLTTVILLLTAIGLFVSQRLIGRAVK